MEPTSFFKFYLYQGGRIQQEELNSNDCAVKITDIQEFENGTWECSVTVKDSNDNFDIGVGHIEVELVRWVVKSWPLFFANLGYMAHIRQNSPIYISQSYKKIYFNLSAS